MNVGFTCNGYAAAIFFWWLLSLWFKCVGRTIWFSVLDFSQNSLANCVCNISHLELPLNLKIDHEL